MSSNTLSRRQSSRATDDASSVASARTRARTRTYASSKGAGLRIVNSSRTVLELFEMRYSNRTVAVSSPGSRELVSHFSHVSSSVLAPKVSARQWSLCFTVVRSFRHQIATHGRAYVTTGQRTVQFISFKRPTAAVRNCSSVRTVLEQLTARRVSA